jgi:peroxiredoxin
VKPLSGELQNLLTDPAKQSVPTESHALLKQPAPSFALIGADDKKVDLSELVSRGPVVLVFYYGYGCDHCVAQLFGINKDLRYFSELNATVVAVSPDTPEHTRTQYAEYGKFDFPVLCDRDNRAVAAKYGVFRPATGELSKWQAHGTFVIGRDRIIRWANTGAEPFTENVTLLRELAAAEGRHPAPSAKEGTR